MVRDRQVCDLHGDLAVQKPHQLRAAPWGTQIAGRESKPGEQAALWPKFGPDDRSARGNPASDLAEAVHADRGHALGKAGSGLPVRLTRPARLQAEAFWREPHHQRQPPIAGAIGKKRPGPTEFMRRPPDASIHVLSPLSPDRQWT
ncbi:hypothetical protein ACFPH6_25215 [Streptomyces xiangluensis]|uniref:Uncharacterized protein n=1 Tax=Streptomyces xiangluensis TaxID=2665720 RepID=A0ABV8YR80_9ACTN